MDRHNILLVDGELLSRDLLSNHLKHNGFKVFAVESCAEARKLIPQNRFRLAIINSQFGEKDTKDLVARLRASESDALVFLLSPQARDAESLTRLNIHEAILKPFRLEEVSVKLRHAVEIISLREALRRSVERVRKLEEEIRSFRSVEDEVKIPDLSEVDLKKEPSPKNSTARKEEKPRETMPVQGDGTGDLPHESNKITGDQAIEQIRKLDDLRKAGILTEEEFNNKKQELLKRI
jgi:response regulator RpfG family c-di-GMP phosphodiesterase